MKSTEYQKKGFWNIRTKLSISFCSLFFVVLSGTKLMDVRGVPFTSYSGTQGELKADAFQELNLVADMKKERLTRWLQERTNDSNLFSSNKFLSYGAVFLLSKIAKLVSEGKTHAELWTLLHREKIYTAVEEYLKNIKKKYLGYNKIQIADTKSSMVIASTEEGDLGVKLSNNPSFLGALKSRDEYISDIELTNDTPTLTFASTIKDEKSNIIAILLMQVNANNTLKPILYTGDGLGKKSEALLVNSNAKIILFLKHPLPNGNAAKPLKYRIKAEAAVLAASGKEGIIESNDYRGEPVLAAYRHIRISSELGWGMVVKCDKSELFSPLQRNLIYSFFIGLLGIIAYMFFSIVLAEKLTRPILILSQAATKVGKGCFCVRVPTNTSDEIGVLAVTFNHMLEQIQCSHKNLEKQVDYRTIELKAVNEVLEKENIERKRAEKALQNALTEVKSLKNRLQAENIYLKDEIKLEHNFKEIIGQKGVFKKALCKIEKVACTNSTVLILGESGTGKELFARAIHDISKRKKRPLVKINCAALPANLMESEMFGYEKGAFSGAFASKDGYFKLADNGTIFLDEIGDLPLELQGKLLRVLQEGELKPLGSVKSIKVDVRVIAATNRNLEEALKNGTFREDLYYRLNIFPIKIPPLREHKEDIPILINHFVLKYSTKIGKKIKNIPLNVMHSLQAYHWPGNIRELENIIERAIILTNGPSFELEEELGTQSTPPRQGEKLPTLKENEEHLILKALEENSWVIEGKSGAALCLDIPPSTLREKMKKHGIRRPSNPNV